MRPILQVTKLRLEQFCSLSSGAYPPQGREEHRLALEFLGDTGAQFSAHIPLWSAAEAGQEPGFPHTVPGSDVLQLSQALHGVPVWAGERGGEEGKGFQLAHCPQPTCQLGMEAWGDHAEVPKGCERGLPCGRGA